LHLPIDLEIGSLYDRKELHEKYGGQNQGGISTPRTYPVIFLFSSPRGREYGYQDGWKEDGFYHYTGEGQRGHMDFVRGNRAVRDHAKQGKVLLLFETTPDGRRRFVGPMEYVDHYFKEIPDSTRALRRGIIFRLAPADVELDAPGEPPSRTGLQFLSSRDRALLVSRSPIESRDTRFTYYQRSAYVKKYVLERANGFCEACGEPAPFARPDGTPYLEVHDTTRLSDSGLDDPRHVIACCPTCHRKVHYGEGGSEHNRVLRERILAVEEAIGAGKFLLVTAAILVNGEGRVLLTQRAGHGALAGKWEFSGGKVEEGETLIEGLRREITEELEIELEEPRPFLMVDHTYPEFHVRLVSFLATSKSERFRLRSHQRSMLVPITELGTVDLADADIPIATALQARCRLELQTNSD